MRRAGEPCPNEEKEAASGAPQRHQHEIRILSAKLLQKCNRFALKLALGCQGSRRLSGTGGTAVNKTHFAAVAAGGIMAPRLPKRGGGRPTPERAAADLAADLALCGWLEDRWQVNGFAFGSGGWGYVAEGEGIITKAELDAFETWLARVRKDGLLNPDVSQPTTRRGSPHMSRISITMMLMRSPPKRAHGPSTGSASTCRSASGNCWTPMSR